MVILIPFQTAYKTVLKKALKIFWKKTKIFASFIFSRVDDRSKSLPEEDRDQMRRSIEVRLNVIAQTCPTSFY
jgi:hypothetical protein